MTKVKKGQKVQSDYVKALIEIGTKTPHSPEELVLPDWADLEKIKRARLFFVMNVNAWVFGILSGLVTLFAIPSMLAILSATKNSSNPAAAYRRYKTNVLNTQAWYKHDLKPGTPAWASLETVRKVHISMNKFSSNQGLGIISQKDLVATQFLYLGYQVTQPEVLGVSGSRDQFECMVHMWRVVGKLLGIEDRFNLCTANFEESLKRIDDVREWVIKPVLENAGKDFDSYSRVAVQGMFNFHPTLQYEALMFFIRRLAKVPNYNYFADDINYGSKNGSKEILAKMSYFSRSVLFFHMCVHQYFLKNVVTRWIFNIGTILLGLLDKFPILAAYNFGWKNAYVYLKK